MDNPRNEKEILENIKKQRDKINKLGKEIGKVESWNDESFLSDMNYRVEKLYKGIELARMYYKSKKQIKALANER